MMKKFKNTVEIVGGVMRQINLTMLVALVVFASSSHANPTGAEVVSGSATFSQPGVDVLNVTNSNNAIINWQSFSIGAGQTTNFIQPDSSSSVLNRVISNNPSQIYGNLNSNGQVFLINQHGMVIGADAQINTAGFFGSTLNITNQDFLNGDLKFSGGGYGDIHNQGFIYAGEGGNVVLIAPNIENGGVIEVDNGNVILAAGQSITITSLENSAIQFDVQAADDTITNLGSIIAHNGAASLFAGSLTHSGSIEATGLVQNADGSISLVATSDIHVMDTATLITDGASGGNITVQSLQGDVYFSGSASAQGELQAGGSIELLGDRVGLFGAASVDASGATGGGEILIGGDYQGQGGTQTAWQTQVSSDAVIRADAIESGNGGKVIVWADGYTQFTGTASATGGVTSGNGGLIEFSGKDNLLFDGFVDTTASNGIGGTVLFDPKNITISNADGTTYDPALDGFIEFPATDVTFSATSLETILNGSQNLVLQANNDIRILDDLTVSAAVTGGDLTLAAGRSIDIRANIFTGNGNLNLVAHDSRADSKNRDPGAAQITMANGITLDSGTGGINITMDIGSGVGTNGLITLANIHASDLSIAQAGILTGAGVTTTGITSFVSGSLSNLTWVNSGIVEWVIDGDFGLNTFMLNNAKIVNNGIFAIDALGSGGQTVGMVGTGSTFSNKGFLVINAGIDAVDFGLAFDNQAGAIAINSGSFGLGGADLTLGTGSSLQGNGVFIGNVINDAGFVTAGTFNPFDGSVSTGTLRITGNYTQNTNASLVIKLDTTINGLQSDIFDIGGTFEVTGNITFAPINNATLLEIALMVGQTFKPFNIADPIKNPPNVAFTSQTIPTGIDVEVDGMGIFTIVATSSTLSQLSTELDKMIEEGEFSEEQYFQQVELLRQELLEKQKEGDTPVLVCI